MGIDFLDVIFRLEKRYAIRITRADTDALLERRPHPAELTAADLAALVQSKRTEAGDSAAPLAEHLNRAVPCMTCRRPLHDLPRTAYCPHCGTPAAESQIWLGVRQTLEDALGAPADEIHPHSRLFRDLGMG